jgi:hypothetical protein
VSAPLLPQPLPGKLLLVLALLFLNLLPCSASAVDEQRSSNPLPDTAPNGAIPSLPLPGPRAPLVNHYSRHGETAPDAAHEHQGGPVARLTLEDARLLDNGMAVTVAIGNDSAVPVELAGFRTVEYLRHVPLSLPGRSRSGKEFRDAPLDVVPGDIGWDRGHQPIIPPGARVTIRLMYRFVPDAMGTELVLGIRAICHGMNGGTAAVASDKLLVLKPKDRRIAVFDRNTTTEAIRILGKQTYELTSAGHEKIFHHEPETEVEELERALARHLRQ